MGICWKNKMKNKREIADLCEDYSSEWMEGETENHVKVIERMNVNDYIIATGTSSSEDTGYFQRYIKNLNDAGLDIGKKDNGKAKYSYETSKPEKNSSMRELIIFRRK